MLVRIVGPFAFAYFLSYLFRVVNAVAGPGLMRDIGLDIGSLGLLTSTYFLTFAAAQVPLGVALDRYGPRLVESLLLLVAAVGALVFALADGLWALAIGRGLIGLGVSAALMGAFKAFSMAAPLERLPTLNGIQLAAGALGALAGGTPADLTMEVYGWRGLFIGLAALSLIAAALVAAFGPRWQATTTGERLGVQLRAVGTILVDPIFVRVALFCVPSQATALAVQGLWAGPWLRDVQGLGPASAAAVLSVMAVAMMVGYLGFGALASRVAGRGGATIHVAIGGMVAFMATQAALIVVPVEGGVVTWIAFAFFATSGVLMYPALTALYPSQLAGRVNTALNFLVFTVSFAVQWLVGVALDSFSSLIGMKSAFDVVFLALLGLQAVGLVVLLFRLPTAVRR